MTTLDEMDVGINGCIERHTGGGSQQYVTMCSFSILAGQRILVRAKDGGSIGATQAWITRLGDLSK